MKNKTIFLYDNTNYLAIFDEVKKFLFDTYADVYIWQTINSVPENMVYDEIKEYDYRLWSDFYDNLDDMLNETTYILTGTCRKCNSLLKYRKFIHCSDELLDSISHLEKVRFYDENGHLKISGYHHDGEDSYELKKLTNLGMKIAMKNDFSNNKKLLKKIMKYKVYSTLPCFTKKYKNTLINLLNTPL